MVNLSPEEIIQKLGIERYIGDPDQFDVVGAPPLFRVALVRKDARLAVVHFSDITLIDAIHEALHGCCGPAALEDEGFLMAYEWAVCQFLNADAYRKWRREFAEYSLSDGVYNGVGYDDTFLQSQHWKSLVSEAKEKGFLTETGQPVWGLGPHRDFICSTHKS